MDASLALSDAERRMHTERRLVGRFIAYWETVRGNRDVPSQADFNGHNSAPFADNMFVVEVGPNEHECRLVAAGRDACKVFGFDPTGMRASDVLPSALEQRLSLCETVASYRKPAADAGRFINSAGNDMMYRSVIVPISDENQSVTHLMGAINYKQLN